MGIADIPQYPEPGDAWSGVGSRSFGAEHARPHRDRRHMRDHVGLVAGLFDARGRGAVRDRAPRPPPAPRIVTTGAAVHAMVRNGLGCVRQPRARVPRWCQDNPTARRLAPVLSDAPHLPDEALGRAVETRAAAGVTARSRWGGGAPLGAPRLRASPASGPAPGRHATAQAPCAGRPSGHETVSYGLGRCRRRTTGPGDRCARRTGHVAGPIVRSAPRPTLARGDAQAQTPHLTTGAPLSQARGRHGSRPVRPASPPSGGAAGPPTHLTSNRSRG